MKLKLFQFLLCWPSVLCTIKIDHIRARAIDHSVLFYQILKDWLKKLRNITTVGGLVSVKLETRVDLFFKLSILSIHFFSLSIISIDSMSLSLFLRETLQSHVVVVKQKMLLRTFIMIRKKLDEKGVP